MSNPIMPDQAVSLWAITEAVWVATVAGEGVWKEAEDRVHTLTEGFGKVR
jgi:hypothetical protein